jgi:hypothetical protein
MKEVRKEAAGQEHREHVCMFTEERRVDVPMVNDL